MTGLSSTLILGLLMLRLQAQGTIRPHAELRRRYPNLLKRQEPVIKLVDFTTPPGLCHNQPCKDTPLLPADRLNRYKAVARLLETGYCKPEWTTTWTCAACISSDSPVKNTSNVKVFATADKMVEGMMGVNEDLKAIFLTFQGVQHSQQWYRSFQHQMTDLGDGIKGHDGYMRSWDQVLPQFEKDFKELVAKYPSHSIIVAGHSFGGGLATVMGYMIAKGKLGPDVTPSKTELITLGSSRAGNRAFANVINKAGFRDTSRLVHSTDAVAHMPWATGTDPFMHHRGEVWLSSVKQEWVTCDDTDDTEAENCSNSIPAFYYSARPHTSYWTRVDTYLCPPQPSKSPLEVEYLPKFALIRY